MKKGNDLSVFLDTTFLLPFFQVEIKVEGFHLDRFKQFISSISKIHTSELSVYEAKAKLFRLYRKDRSYLEPFKNFGYNLQVLRDDKRIFFHTYSSMVDEHFNSLMKIYPELDTFDAIIVSQAVEAGVLLTEDNKLSTLPKISEFSKSSTFSHLEIKRWRDISELGTTG